MRLWSIHPSYLDAKGLVALWREALLAQKVLMGETKGYTNHPQLIRFRECGSSLGALSEYLRTIYCESEKRGYSFDNSKIREGAYHKTIDVTDSQIIFEIKHLLKKLQFRDIEKYHSLRDIQKIEVNPLFKTVVGEIESWEKDAHRADFADK